MRKNIKYQKYWANIRFIKIRLTNKLFFYQQKKSPERSFTFFSIPLLEFECNRSLFNSCVGTFLKSTSISSSSAISFSCLSSLTSDVVSSSSVTFFSLFSSSSKLSSRRIRFSSTFHFSISSSSDSKRSTQIQGYLIVGQ